MGGSIELKVFLAPYKPFHGASKSWDPQREPTWPATTATLIAGDRDAVLVDGLMTLAEGNALLEWIQQTGKQVGHPLDCVYVGQSDVDRSTVVHVPELDAVIAGDVAYNGIHMWLARSDPKSRAAWIEALDAIEQLHPAVVIAGHKAPDAPDDDASRVLDLSRQYIRDFDEIVAASDTAGEIIAKMLARYPDLGNPYTLTYAADTQ
ncbi:MBL fold metallo-hydrolase [Kribbella sp. NPDC055110]